MHARTAASVVRTASSNVPRRSWMASLAAVAATAALGGCASGRAAEAGANRRRPTMVLVHGAWYGGWCWERVTPLLESRGHAVLAPTMQGIAHRSADAASVTLESQVAELIEMFHVLDLRDVVLVGHSYGGMVISLLAERQPARVRQLIYLDAFVPESGKAVVDYLLPVERRQAIVDVGMRTGFVPPVPARALGVVDADDLAYVEARVTPQPFATMSQKAVLSKPAGDGLPRAYVACVNPASGSFGPFARRIEQDPSWQFRALQTGHNVMITAPELLAGTLVELAATPGAAR
jgi:pimeloyl-ACP methyl ester carboxylesterase